jgi:hypothetical protein
MSEVGAADRERLLRSKRSELRYINYALPTARKRRERRIDACIFHRADPYSGIVTSRKRKLREFFAVCDNEGPLPQITLLNVDAPPTSAAEKQFLDDSDILLYVQTTCPPSFGVSSSLPRLARVTLLTIRLPEIGPSTRLNSQSVENYAPIPRNKDHLSAKQVLMLAVLIRRERRRNYSAMGQERERAEPLHRVRRVRAAGRLR